MSLYLLQTLAYKNTDVYKFGCTNSFKTRMRAYDKGSDVVMVWHTFNTDCKVIETEILKALTKNFHQYTDAGKEYFKGSRSLITNCINEHWQNLCLKGQVFIDSSSNEESNQNINKYIGSIREPLSNTKDYTIKHNQFHHVVRVCLQILSETNSVKFHSRPDLMFSNSLLYHNRSIVGIREFVELLLYLPSYIGIIVNNETRVIIRDIDVINNGSRIIISKLRSWEEVRKQFADSYISVKFDEYIFNMRTLDIINTYCLGEVSLAKYSGVVDDINYLGNESLNLWSDYMDNNVTEDGPLPQVNEVITNYIHENMSQGEVDIYNYLIMWFASVVLNPHKKICISPIFVNEDPSKSLFVFLCKHVFKHRYRIINKLEDLTGKENHKMIATSLILCDEFNLKHEFSDNLNTMKHFVTESTFHVQHTDFFVNSVSNFVIFTDNINVKGSKYYPVFDVKPSTVNVFDSLTEADAHNFVKWLTYVDLTEFNIEDPPHNHKVGDKLAELNVEDIFHSLHINELPVDDRYPGYGIKLGEVYDKYLYVCKHHLRCSASSKNVFYTEIRKHYSKANNNAYIAEEHSHKGWYLKQNKLYNPKPTKSIPIRVKK